MKGPIYINRVLSIILTICVAILVNSFLLLYTYSSDGIVMSELINYTSEVIKYNLIPLILLNLFLLFLLNNCIVSNLIFVIFIIAIDFINYTKIDLRSVPLYIHDYKLLSELMSMKSIIPDEALKYGIYGIAALVLLLFVGYRVFTVRKFLIPSRILVLAGIVAVFMNINNTVYANMQAYNAIEVKGNKFNVIDNYESRGLVYSMLYNASRNNSEVTLGEQYLMNTDEKDINIDNIDDVLAKKVAEKLPEVKYVKGNKEEPNIIFLMVEAYSDFPLYSKFNFKGLIDPYENFKKIKEDENCYSERMVVANVGGGTSDTEFDMMLGLNARFFRSEPYALSAIKKPITSVPSTLADIGYSTNYIHPNVPNYYERFDKFNKIGIKNFYDITAFDDTVLRGGDFIPDEQVFDKIIEGIENINRRGNPAYIYSTTIQNHGPYKNKYGIYTPDKVFNSTIKFNKEEEDLLNNYLYGVIDTDIGFKNLIDAINEMDRPTVIVAFGDHIPSFEMDLYDKIIEVGESDISLSVERNKVPFFIYENDASKKEYNISDELNGLDIDLISSFYIPLLILHGYDMLDLNSYFKYTYGLIEDYPVVLEDIYFADNEKADYIYSNEEMSFLKYITSYFFQ
ncbi:MAG: LTA synthase family protein [Lachnospirales bacterium]